jgi:hypothetical protein
VEPEFELRLRGILASGGRLLRSAGLFGIAQKLVRV